MNTFDEILQKMEVFDKRMIINIKPFIQTAKETTLWIDSLEDDFKEFLKTGKSRLYPDIKVQLPNSSTSESSPDSSKENHRGISQGAGRPSRLRRNAFREASALLNQQVNISLNSKLRQPDHDQNKTNVTIKTERLTEDFNNQEIKQTDSADQSIKIKSEVTEMPPPLHPPKQRRKKQTTVQISPAKLQIKEETEGRPRRTTRALTKQLRDTVNIVRNNGDSIIIHNDIVQIVHISDSDEETSSKEMTQKTRSKRTKTRTKPKAKRNHSSSSETSDKNSKKHKAAKNDVASKTDAEKSSSSSKVAETSVYEDAVSVSINENEKIVEEMRTMNCTVVLDKAHQIMNETVVLHKSVQPKGPEVKACNGMDTMMTDDESFDEISKSVKKPAAKKAQTPKQVFSPYGNSPVKQRVQAFEKLGLAATAIPARITRTKKRAMELEASEKEGLDQELAAKEKNDKTAGKGVTPLTSLRVLPSTTNACRIRKLGGGTPATSSSTESLNKNKSCSSIKMSKAELHERHQIHKKLDDEMLRQREELFQAQMKEQKRKRDEESQKRRRVKDEKFLRAQQTRQALEKERQIMMENEQKAKEEKAKQLLAEREEKFQKQREEAHRKRVLAAKKAAEEKHKEAERKRLEEAKLLEAEKYKLKDVVPIYYAEKTPLLPTDDCYDSDDPDCKPISNPSWCKRDQLGPKFFAQMYAGSEFRNTFFNCAAQTIDLREIFLITDPRVLKRTSSAIWRKPPRFTLMPVMEEDAE